ncbi:protein SEMI-ROLLED LEAF 2-like [Quercus robur]|uniref:protein SEMI-ROLLED LEAF 2-like n=1 Tax=Quercus robur TaxID=38942 RepID=UPI00216213FB|nr:protein SEMI-ROLLED LEAF 2-like [Quercus robur]
MWQDGPPNERKIVTLCEYAVKNLVRIPKIAKYLEERCYKELRVEHIKFINIVWERFTRLAAEAKAAKIERNNARQMETEALERERIAKRRSEKYRVAA